MYTYTQVKSMHRASKVWMAQSMNERKQTSMYIQVESLKQAASGSVLFKHIVARVFMYIVGFKHWGRRSPDDAAPGNEQCRGIVQVDLTIQHSSRHWDH